MEAWLEVYPLKALLEELQLSQEASLWEFSHLLQLLRHSHDDQTLNRLSQSRTSGVAW